MKIIDKKQIIEIQEQITIEHPEDETKSIILEKGDKIEVIKEESNEDRPSFIDEYKEAKKAKKEQDDEESGDPDDDEEEKDEKKKKKESKVIEIEDEIELIVEDKKITLEKGDKIQVID